MKVTSADGFKEGVCQMANTSEKRSSSPKGTNGQWDRVFKLILDQVEDKNPGDLWGNTPLHMAAVHGNIFICTVGNI